MRSANGQLKTALKTLLTTIGYPVYSDYLPSAVSPDAYILISDIASVDASTMQTDDTETALQIGIFTNSNIANDGTVREDIADQVFTLLLPSPGSSALDLGADFQNCGIALVNDTSQTIQFNSFVGLNRFLTFKFQLYHKP